MRVCGTGWDGGEGGLRDKAAVAGVRILGCAYFRGGAA